MIRHSKKLSSTTLSRATRLQLGNIQTPNGAVSSAAGSHEKWGYAFRKTTFPISNTLFYMVTIGTGTFVMNWAAQYRDIEIYSKYICYEDVKDRCLTPIPGWGRFGGSRWAQMPIPNTHRLPHPLDWMPFELKLGAVKQASY